MHLEQSPSIGKDTRGLGNKRKSRDPPDCSIIKIGQNTEYKKLEETCCYLNSSEKLSANAGVKNSQRTKDNAIRTNHIKARIDKTQQNSKCRLCGDRDETINHIISECSKLAQKEYKARHDWVGKVIHWEMCRKFQFDHTNKWYMHNPAPVLEK